MESVDEEQKVNLNRQNVSKNHVQHINFQCDTCRKTFKRIDHFKKHLTSSHDNETFCSICKKNFTDVSIKQHIVSDHGKNNPVSCNLCSKPFKRQFQLNIHSRSVHTEKSHKCGICEVAFKAKNHLTVHFQTVHAKDDKEHKCDFCSKTYDTKLGLTTHLMALHKKSGYYKCTLCVRAFSSKHDLGRHFKSIHLTGYPPM